MIVLIVNVKDVIVIVPNKKAKQRKNERKEKNAWLVKFGRTAKQIARWKRKNKGKSIGDKKNGRW